MPMPSPLVTAILAMALLSSMDALVKGMSVGLGTWQVVWMRFTFGLLTVLPFAWPHVRSGIARASLVPNLARGVLLVILASCFFFALGRLPLIEAVTLVFTAPIWVTVFARAVLGEPFTARTLVAVLLGFAGVLVVYAAAPARGSEAIDVLGIAAALSAAMMYGLMMVLARRQTARDAVPMMVLLQCVAAVIVAAPLAAMAWEMPTGTQIATFVVIGGLGTGGSLLLTNGLARAPAGDIAAAEYTSLFWAAAYGSLFFGESLGREHLIGGGLIVVGCAIASRAAPERIAAAASAGTSNGPAIRRTKISPKRKRATS